jgi:peptidyl-dipeptidase Dcp
MHRFALLLLPLALACAHAPTPAPTEAPVPPESVEANPLLAEWSGPYGGTPAFEAMDLRWLEPALEQAMAEHIAELQAIAEDPSPPSFDNTILAIEGSGRTMQRVMPSYYVWSGSLSTPEFRDIQLGLAPRLSAYRTTISQNQALFARVRAVLDSPELASRAPEDQRLVELIHDGFTRQGVELSGPEKERYAAIQERLAELYTRFGNNVLADEESTVLYLDEDQLAGLPHGFVAAAAELAEARGQDGHFAITNTRSSVDPFLTFSDERALREQVWRSFTSRGDNGDEHDNNAIIAEILQLRHERARLQGYDSYAHWRLEDRMAGTPDQALALMQALWPSAVARVEQEVADMQAVADAEGAGITIEPWDYRYYAEKVRQQRYELDSEQLRQYLQLDRMVDAMFMVAGELFGYGFEPVPEGSVAVFHPDVRVWEVSRADNGELVGLFYLDPYAREGKQSGAWASGYRGHTSFDGQQLPLISNNCNFIPAADGQPTLLSWDDAITLFHEFGHALHGLASRARYPTTNGGVRDYTETQAQLLERWLLSDRVIQGFMLHHETGEPMPAELVDRLVRAGTFNQGFDTTEYVASALVDMLYHTVDPTGLDPRAFEREQLAALGMPPQLVMRHRSPHFSHAFEGEGYAAGYYSYLWADVLTADAAEAFAEAPGGFYDAEVAARMVEHLFAPRNAVDPAEAYRAFRGRDATVDALLRHKGFPLEP